MAQLAAQRATQELQAAIDTHGAEWREQLQRESDAVDRSWEVAVETLRDLHAERIRAHAKLRAVGGSPSLSIGPALVNPAQAADSVTGEKLAPAMGQMVLDAKSRHGSASSCNPTPCSMRLAKMGNPDPIPEFIPGGGVAKQIREAMEHAASVQRGYAPDEDNAPAVGAGPRYRESAPAFEFES